MSRMDHHVLHLARVVLEARTALSITTGSAEGVFDTALVRDANGLPALPASAVAGVLRHLWIDTHGQGEVASADTLFGFQKKDAGAASRLIVSWGALLDSKGRPAEGLLAGNDRERRKDPLYQAVLQQADAPVVRDRVRLTHRGAADDRGKFDRTVLPAGHRFALELRLWGKAQDDDDWHRLLGLFAHPLFRVGGATRAGLGAMRLVSCHTRHFDLKDADDSRAFRALGRGLTDTDGLEIYEPRPPATNDVLSGRLKLKARGLWRIGQGDEPLSTRDEPGRPLKAADLLPKLEECIEWPDGKGERKLRLCLVPGSALKGALAHRMAFHARRRRKDWAGEGLDEDVRNARPPEVAVLMGEVKDTREEDGRRSELGRAGALFIDDAWIEADPKRAVRLMHNAIDRFTAGVRDRVLYEEESLLGGELTVPVALDLRRIPHEHREAVRRALHDALNDLCQGRLALGSRTTAGNGFFDGELEGSLRRWLDQDDAKEVAA